jgi:hypothetical protein
MMKPTRPIDNGIYGRTLGKQSRGMFNLTNSQRRASFFVIRLHLLGAFHGKRLRGIVDQLMVIPAEQDEIFILVPFTRTLIGDWRGLTGCGGLDVADLAKNSFSSDDMNSAAGDKRQRLPDFTNSPLDHGVLETSCCLSYLSGRPSARVVSRNDLISDAAAINAHPSEAIVVTKVVTKSGKTCYQAG